jgi:four helix bundle protein
MKDEPENSLVDIGSRTKRFALRVIHVFRALPQDEVAHILGKQMLRSGTSVGAHFREARRGGSNAEFVSKLEGALQELDQTAYWLELLVEAEILAATRLDALQSECNELIAILVTMAKRAKG